MKLENPLTCEGIVVDSLIRKASQLTRDRMNTRPFMRIGVSMSMLKSKENPSIHATTRHTS